MKINVRHSKFVIWHGVALLCVLLLPLLLKIVSWFSGIGGGCIMRRFFIYCPLCGGTRAVGALVRFDFLAAWNYNPLVVLLSFACIALDLWAWVRYFQKKRAVYHFPKLGVDCFGSGFVNLFYFAKLFDDFFWHRSYGRPRLFLGCGARTKGLTIGRCRRSALFLSFPSKRQKIKKSVQKSPDKYRPSSAESGGIFLFL
jgi:hypothetical protein